MEWLGDGPPVVPGGESCCNPAFMPRGVNTTHPQPQQPLCDSTIPPLLQNQQRCITASIGASWRLAEAQDQLGSLELHGSESLEQERAQNSISPTELSHAEQEWRRKESMLGSHDPRQSPVLGAVGSWDVFDKSIINVQNHPVDMEQDRNKTFVQKHEQELRHFGMLRRWDDSQRFLADLPQLICEETANYLILWCFRLQHEQKEALMEQVAHQAVVLQFILEMASTSHQDPRGCFRQFFHKAKAGQEGYLDVFHSELQAFIHRVKEYTLKSKGDVPPDAEHQTAATRCRLHPKEVLDSLSPVAEHHVKCCLEGGLWSSTGRWAKDENPTETDDIRMMETS